MTGILREPVGQRYRHLMQRLWSAVLTTAGATEPALRERIEGVSARIGGGVRIATGTPPVALQPYIDKVARHASTISDADLDALKQAGYSEDAIFEITASAALGAAVGRLERGLAALKGEV